MQKASFVAPVTRGLLRFVVTFVAIACAWSLGGSQAGAQVISGTFAGPILSGSTATLVNGASIVGNISNDGTLEFALTDPLENTFSISGSGNVILSGSSGTGGTITFSNGNSYTGGTVIHYGTLSIVTGGTISHPAANMVVGEINGDVGFLTISGGSVSSLDGDLGFLAGSSGTASISAGTWSMAGDFNVGYAGAGDFTMTGGSVNVVGSALVGRDSSSTGTFTMSGGTTTIGSALQVGFGGTGTLSVTGGLISSVDGSIGENPGSSGTVTVTTGTWTMSNDLSVGISGTGTLTIGNGGVVVVANNVNRSGTSGTLNLNAGGVLAIGTGGTTGSLNTDLVNDGEVQFNRSTDFAYLGLISGTGTLVKDGGGKLTFSTANSYTGGTDIYGGTIEVASNGTIDHSSAPLNIGSSDGSIGGLDVTGGLVNASTIDLFNGTFSISGGAVSSGTATLGNVGSGTATIGNGTFDVANGMTIGAAGGTGQMDIGLGGLVTTGTVGGLAGNTTLGAGSGSTGTVTVGDGASWFNYGNLAVGDGGTGQLTISSSGDLLVTGTLSQGAGSTITIDNSAGTLRIGDGGATGTLSATTLTNEGTVIFNSTTDTSAPTSISGSGNLTKLNTNALTLTGSSSYTGATNLDEGALYVNGELGLTTLTGAAGTLLAGSGTIAGPVVLLSGTTTSGTLSPGATPNSFGTLTVGSLLLSGTDETLTTNVVTIMSITGTTAGVDYDQVAGLVEGSAPLVYGGILDLTLSGTFYENGTTFNLFSNFSSVSGNFSQLVLNTALGSSYAGLGFTFDEDAQIWRTGVTTEGNQFLVFDNATGNLVVVPEPGTLALATLGIAVACVGWRHRSGRRARAEERPGLGPAQGPAT